MAIGITITQGRPIKGIVTLASSDNTKKSKNYGVLDTFEKHYTFLASVEVKIVPCTPSMHLCPLFVSQSWPSPHINFMSQTLCKSSLHSYNIEPLYTSVTIECNSYNKLRIDIKSLKYYEDTTI